MGKRGPGARVPRRVSEKPFRPNPSLSRATRVIAFIETLQLTSGEHAGQPFKLRPWQKRIIRGIYRPGVKTAVVTLPRGSGKTQLCAGIMLAHLVGPLATPRAELFSAACDRFQASRIYREALAMALADPELADRVVARDYIKTLTDERTGSVYQAMSADSRKGMGLAPDLAIYDELGSAPGRELYDALNSGLGKKRHSLMIVISTQSARADHVMSELVDHGLKVNAGTLEDNTFHATVYSAPMDADPWAPKTWRACNPALGDFLDLQDFKRMAAQARRSPSFESAFRLYRLNQRVSEAAGFISPADWLACSTAPEPSGPCWLGLDTASTTDLAALVAYWPEAGGSVLAWFWTPQDTLLDREHSDRAPYTAWARAGLLQTTPGRTIDLRALVLKLGELIRDYDVRGVAHDRWRIAELRRLVEEEGIDAPLVDFGTGFRDQAGAVDATERAILDLRVRHGAHPILTWNCSNALVVQDASANRKVDKQKSTGRIDGVAALIMAIGLHAREPGPRVYDFSQPMVLSA